VGAGTERITKNSTAKVAGGLADQGPLGAPGDTGSRTASYSVSGQLLGVMIALRSARASISYDARGDRTSTPGGATTLAYDQAGRLTSYGSTAQYSYDADGLRIAKTVSGVASTESWDVSGSTPQLIGDGASQIIYGLNGAPIERISGTTVTYFVTDADGSVRLITSSTGTTLGTETFTPFGQVASSTGTGASEPLGYDGQYRDTETGYIYLRDRYYDPATAQFLTPDPLSSITRAPYSYANNNPLNESDPSGDDPGTIQPVSHNSLLDDALNLVSKIPGASPALYLAKKLIAGGKAISSCLELSASCISNAGAFGLSFVPTAAPWTNLLEIGYPVEALSTQLNSELGVVLPKLIAQKEQEVDGINALIACNQDELGGVSVVNP
jgi:RHS repeat-associated protein